MLYAVDDELLIKQEVQEFSALGMTERGDLQRLLRAHPAALGEELLVIAEEFGDWEDSKRRIDLLAIDQDARLVVIEIKRTEDGGHMDLQALRYAAMISAMNFDEAVAAYAKYRRKTPGSAGDARDEITAFIGGSGGGGDIELTTDVRIILVSANFTREITTTVLWLNNFDGMDVRCVRLSPYQLDGKTYLDIQQVIPLPEARDYQVKLRRKEAALERGQATGHDLSRYHIVKNGEKSESLGKNRAALRMVTELSKSGVPYAAMEPLLPGALQSLPGLITDRDELLDALRKARPTADPVGRWFIDNPMLDVDNDRTWVLSNQWRNKTEEILRNLSSAFGETGITILPEDVVVE